MIGNVIGMWRGRKTVVVSTARYGGERRNGCNQNSNRIGSRILLLNSPSNEIVIRLVLYSHNNVWKVQCVLEKEAIERTLPSGKFSYSYHPVEEFGWNNASFWCKDRNSSSKLKYSLKKRRKEHFCLKLLFFSFHQKIALFRTISSTAWYEYEYL